MGFIETAYSGNPTLKDLEINADLNLKNDYDAIGIKRFVCQDYLGAIECIPSDNLRWDLTLNDVEGKTNSNIFRVPSNFVESNIKIKFYAKNTLTFHAGIHLYLLGEGGSKTSINYQLVPANTTTATEYTISSITVNPCDQLCFAGNYEGGGISFLGSLGVRIFCDINPVSGGYWEIITEE